MKKFVVCFVIIMGLAQTADARMFLVCYKGRAYIINTIGQSLNIDGPAIPVGSCPPEENWVEELTALVKDPNTGGSIPEASPSTYASLKSADPKNPVDTPPEVASMLRDASIKLYYVDPSGLDPKIRKMFKDEEKERKKAAKKGD